MGTEETLKLTLLTPERRVFEGVDVSSVTLPGSEGQIQILPGHASFLGSLETGAFRFSRTQDGGGEDAGVISSGFFRVADGLVTVMAETLELRGDIDVARAKAAQAKAEKMLNEETLDEHQFRKYELKLQRALVRQQEAARTLV